jgi:hypothetical protein
MILNDNIGITGDVILRATDKDGNFKYETNIKNLVVTTGKNHIAARVAGLLSGSTQEGKLISHVGFGTSTTTPTIADTDLASGLGVRVPVSGITHSAGTNIITVSASFTGTAGNVTEAGMFTELTGGTMVCRTTFSSIPLLSTDGLAIIWTLTIN